MATTRSGASIATAEGADAGKAGSSCPVDLLTNTVTVKKYSFGPGDGSDGRNTCRRREAVCMARRMKRSVVAF